MCGISGWLLKARHIRDPLHLSAMADAQAHRGPDDRGYFRDAAAGIAFAHNRLSIIDLSSAGHQPMFSPDGDVAMIFNGEIYNFKDLRKELERLGHRFQSKSDSEVLLLSFVEWGTACFARLNGMFAVAFWVKSQRKLLLARDPLGMKPLYYGNLPRGQGVAFCSEVKSFLALPDFSPRANPVALQQFLEFGYCFDARQTIFENVYKLPPGHFLEVRDGVAEPSKAFFSPPRAMPGVSLQKREEALYATLSEVVEQHLVADVPVGLLLSGGLDSSIVAALASRHGPVTTISMGFADSSIDERSYARIVANHVKSDHREVLIRPEEVSDNLESVVWYFDDLFADWGTVSTRVMYAKCREMGIKVVLVGEGSDELFAGYSSFHAAQDLRGPQFWRLFQLYRRYSGRRFGGQFGAFQAIMSSYLMESDGDWIQAVRLFESRNQLPNNYVMKVDKASMSVSVEARAPFLDRRVAELAFGTPTDQLIQGDSSKRVLRSMAERYALLPPEIVRRPKFGASIATSWMDESKHFRAFSRQTILENSQWADRLGLRGAMTDYFDRGRSGYRFPHSISLFSNLAWRLLLLSLWSQRYLPNG